MYGGERRIRGRAFLPPAGNGGIAGTAAVNVRVVRVKGRVKVWPSKVLRNDVGEAVAPVVAAAPMRAYTPFRTVVVRKTAAVGTTVPGVVNGPIRRPAAQGPAGMSTPVRTRLKVDLADTPHGGREESVRLFPLEFPEEFRCGDEQGEPQCRAGDRQAARPVRRPDAARAS